MKQIKLYSILFFLVQNSFSYCQVKGDNETKLRKQLNLYLTKFANDTSNKKHAYNIACNYSLLNLKDSAFIFIQKALHNGYVDRWLLHDSDFDNLKNEKEWKLIKQKMNEDFILKNPSVDTSIVFELFKMKYKDQFVRFEFMSLMDKYGFKSTKLDSIKSVTRKIGILNRNKLDSLINKHGWFNKSIVGANGMKITFLIIQHGNNEYKKKYLDCIKYSVDLGEIPKRYFANFIDRILSADNKKQRYGTELRLINGKGNKYELTPVEDENNLNKRRAKMGLEPIEDYLLRNGIEYILPEK